MIMHESYKEDLSDRLRSLPPEQAAAITAKTGLTIPNLLSDTVKLENLWYNYEKDITEYECDEDFSFYHAINEVLGVSLQI